jgi:cystathionine gamma-synthase
MQDVLIVPYSSAHRDGVVVALAAVRAAGGSYPPPYVSEEAADIAEWLERYPAAVRLVAVLGDEVIGHVQLTEADQTDPDLPGGLRATGAYNPDAVIELARLFVDPAHRRSGVGRALLRAATATGWRMGYRPALCVMVTQTEAVELYRREGWQAAGSFTGHPSGVENLIFLAPEPGGDVTGFVHAGVRGGTARAVATGIEVSTTFSMDHPGEYGEFAYARSQNPTRKALEEALAVAEGAAHAMAFSSGLAAIDAVLRLVGPHERVIIGTDAYGGTWRLLDKVWSRYGIGVDVVDVRDAVAVEAAWTPSTRLVLVETPSNPLLAIADIGALAGVVHAHGGVLAVDNTFATPWLQRPLALGADVVIHSATKYLGGHSDVVAGALATDRDDLADEFRFSQRAVGAVPGPFDSFLVLRGMRTLPLRVDRQCENAAAVADMLADHPAVSRVYYPGRADHVGHDVALRQMRAGGGMVSFSLHGGERAAIDTVKRTRLITLAESLGAVESLIEHPASMTHAANAGSSLAVDPGLVRLSVGIEDVWALIADLRQALPGK